MSPNEKSQAVRLGSACVGLLNQHLNYTTTCFREPWFALFLTPPTTHQAVLWRGVRPTKNRDRQAQFYFLSNFVKNSGSHVKLWTCNINESQSGLMSYLWIIMVRRAEKLVPLLDHPPRIHVKDRAHYKRKKKTPEGQARGREGVSNRNSHVRNRRENKRKEKNPAVKK